MRSEALHEPAVLMRGRSGGWLPKAEGDEGEGARSLASTGRPSTHMSTKVWATESAAPGSQVPGTGAAATDDGVAFGAAGR